MNLFRKKGLGQVHLGLNRHLRLWDLDYFRIGAMVGTGIFTITGTAANLAGPAPHYFDCDCGLPAYLPLLCRVCVSASLQLVEPIVTSMPSLESFQPGLPVG